MQILKFIAVALGVPLIALIMVVVMIVCLIVAYVAWLGGYPVKVKVNGKDYRYRWIKRVY